jgi:hypothetical protein
MNIIPTAEEFLKQYELGNTGKIDSEDSKEMLLEFAKLHVEAALKAASEIKRSYKSNFLISQDILNSYPLINIK